ncbi:MAG TPA: InlB B-repeat-containing protein [Ruminococcus sp.]|nr:InlB B-repeat-containing protein [Ruminococcus sp.]
MTGCDNPEAPIIKNESFYVTLYNTGSAPKSFNVTKGDSFTLPTYTRTYYTLNGWNTSPDGNGTSYSLGDMISVSSDVVLYGQWTINNKTMTLTSSEFGAFVYDRTTFDQTLAVTIKISDRLPDLYYLTRRGYNLNITLDLSSCTELVNLSNSYHFPKDIVGIVFPSSIRSIYTGAFYDSNNISSVVFSDGSPKSWYIYAPFT